MGSMRGLRFRPANSPSPPARICKGQSRIDELLDHALTAVHERAGGGLDGVYVLGGAHCQNSRSGCPANKHRQLGRAHCALDQVDEVAPRGLVGVALVKRALICGPDAKIPSEPARLAIAMDSVFMNFYEQ